MLRILIADDHEIVRRGIRDIVESHPGWEVCGEASDGQAAVELATVQQPDVAVIDVSLPLMNGLAVTRRLRQDSPQTNVLLFTMHDDDETVSGGLAAGARGYLLKGADREEIRQALDTVSRGGIVFSSGIATRVLGYFAGGGASTATVPFPELTEREREILDLVARGLTNTEIASRLVLSPKTVRNHVSNVFTKLQVATRAEAVAHARDAGLGSARGHIA